VFVAGAPGDGVADALQARGEESLASIPESLASLARTHVPLMGRSPMGIAGLRTLGAAAGLATALPGPAQQLPPGLLDLVDELAAAGGGVVMTMGKGGVGKTTIAAAVAVDLASRGFDVHLSTTDPAAHLEGALGDSVAGIEVARIDPVVEVAAYSRDVMAAAGDSLDAQGRAMLEEDLRSPCTEEIAVFRAFARTVALAKDRFVILDTAPTGHTLLLIDATQAYHREVLRNAGDVPIDVSRLLPTLRDPGATRVIIVTLPETTPVLEATRLQEDLERADIHPFAWVVNQSLAYSGTADPVLTLKGSYELPLIAEVRDRLADRMAVVPWVPAPPVGPAGLAALVRAELS